MKSEIHECQKNKLLRVSKKVMLMVALFLGTTAMVNAQEPAKTAPAKEVKAKKVKKAKAEKKEVAPAAAPAAPAKAKK
jgi:hypothetical protein